ncbi:YwqI/YxiC family protein [Halobacillus naozhouensis]|uniref:YwqI/YxiC family protein n=1 Tax=Halobacillus naozhouensis TaxID=554880 RepID=A0ABY8IX31_9BACI|nr:YwqI/YxiC family protein [Halobacillus naozhouensis]WFT74807.1 YwqI/YxiC family protein [Halobacillus naozhouensis]
MPEIKVKPNEVEPVLKRLKERTNDLNTTNPEPQFPTSILNFIERIHAIEDKYYQTLDTYKTTLIKVEDDISSSIETLVQTEQRLAQQMKEK